MGNFLSENLAYFLQNEKKLGKIFAKLTKTW